MKFINKCHSNSNTTINTNVPPSRLFAVIPNNQFLCCLFAFALLLLLSTVPSPLVNAVKASINYVPKGSSALLFQSGVDQIIQLDEYTFDDTVLEANRTNAFVVNFYGDWCGHCRAFAPHCRLLASLICSWSDVVKIAAINCADTYNEKICKANGVTYFPMIKYFPRNATHHADAILMDTKPSVESLRELLAAEVLSEYSHANYPDWPNLHTVTAADSVEKIWAQQTQHKSTANFLLLIFDANNGSTIGVQTALDLWPHRALVAVRRVVAAIGTGTAVLANKLAISTFPHAVLFKRDNEQQPILSEQFERNSTLNKVAEKIGLGTAFFEDKHNGDGGEESAVDGNSTMTASTDEEGEKTKPSATNMNQVGKQKMKLKDGIVDCAQFPERCKALYFISETDLLKSMRMALLDEVTLVDGELDGERLERLHAFVSALREHFPTKTYNREEVKKLRKRGTTIPRATTIGTRLERSERAKLVFAHMDELLERRKKLQAAEENSNSTSSNSISTREWRSQFENVERVYGFPFAQNASWEHCAGSSADYRGYTCALWTAFHSLSVNAYIGALQYGNGVPFKPLAPLKAIQGWVLEFFGCDYCRRHFAKMTMLKFPMNAQRVQRANDVPMYLWRAHNIVNKRLRGHITEDPQFPKYQFPPPFLCPTCNSGGLFSRRQTLHFLLRYYGSIRPAQEGNQAASGNLGRAK